MNDKVEEIVRSTVKSVGNDLRLAKDRLKNRGFAGSMVEPYLEKIKTEWAERGAQQDSREAVVAPAKQNKEKHMAPKNKKQETKPKLRVASAKAGTAKKCDLNYFPPEGSMSFNELKRIVDSGKEGVSVAEYKLSEMFLGRLVRCGLVESDGENLFATERTKDILSGEIELPSTRGSEFNRIVAAMKTETDPAQFKALAERLSQLSDEQVERNAARQEEKEEQKKSA
jgi:hypothetical protein